ncbi:AraC family transcriptional regulator [Nocardia colli]|nr:AraC family transcriptional regulator [Nocardia colli]
MMEGTIPARTAAVIRATALHVGVADVQLAHETGLDAADLENDLLRVPTQSVWRIWELIDATAGPGSGLLAAAEADRGRLHVWDYLFSSHATLAESLRTVIELRAVVTDPGVEWELVQDGSLLTIRTTASVEPELVLAPVEEFVLATMLRRMREATRQQLEPVRVAFTHRASGRYTHLVDGFGTRRIDFGAPHSEITFLDVGALPTGADPHLGQVLRNYAALNLAAARPVSSWHDKLQAAVTAALAEGDLDLDGVAGRLAVSPRTVQRRLGEAGTSWRATVDAVRHRRATDLLRDTDLPVRSVAARVGYTDARALRRAFLRWTGHTPDDFRRAAIDRPA